MKRRKLKLWKLSVAFIVLIIAILLPIILLNGYSKERDKMSPKEDVFKGIERETSITHQDDTRSFERLDDILNDPRLQGTTTTVSVRKASDGAVIYDHSGDVRVRPASVMKLLTSAVVLEKLGPDYTFKTELLTDGEIKKGIVQGNLYLRGQGDPTLMAADLTNFAAHLKSKGIQTVNGNIYGDDSWYDDIRLSQDLNWSDELYVTGAQVSALTISPNEDYDAGTLIIEVGPGKKVGELGAIQILPKSNYVRIVNSVQTVGKKEAKRIQVERTHGSNEIVVSGTIPIGSAKVRNWTSVWEPTDFVTDLLEQALVAEGIQLSKSHEVGRRKVPKDATTLATKQSIPLEQLLIPFMKLSNNGHGELLVKELGKVIAGEGSWEKGLAVTTQMLDEMGINTNTILLRDGSGMSHKTLVTANEVTKLLYEAQNKSWFPNLLKALPVAGMEERLVGGTLRYRMKETAAKGNVKAKTGTLNGVTSLAGYVESKKGETFIFTVIINNHLDDSTFEILDQIAVALANYES